ncbi:MAG TPA: malate synthase A, partial [Jiangellaceae bacterium]
MADIQVTNDTVDRSAEILTAEALAFVADLQRTFGARRDELLRRRAERRTEIAATGRLDFLPATKEIREGDWAVAAAP